MINATKELTLIMSNATKTTILYHCENLPEYTEYLTPSNDRCNKKIITIIMMIIIIIIM
jgi:hypothetical protein